MFKNINLKTLILRNPLFKLLIKAGATNLILDLYWGQNKKQVWQKIEKTGYISWPKSIWFEPTMRCNLNCLFCHQQQRRKLQNKEMNLKHIARLLTDAQRSGIKLIEMIGGEIFLRRDIFEILDLIEAKNIKVKLGTNGVLLNDSVIGRIKEYNCIESISVSIDGPPEVHNKLRNSSQAYQKAVETLKALSESRFMVCIYSVLTPENLNSIAFLINLAQELKIDRLTFMPEMFYSEQEISATRQYLDLSSEEHLFVEVKEVKNIEEYAEKASTAIEEITKLRDKKGIFAPIYPRIFYKYTKTFFETPPAYNKKLICRHFYSLTVIENGDVLICPFIHKKVGNILEDNIVNIWNNDIMRSLRRKILKINLLPICKRCCAADYIT